MSNRKIEQNHTRLVNFIRNRLVLILLEAGFILEIK